VSRAHRVLLFGTARAAQVARVARAIREAAPDTVVDLFAHADVAAAVQPVNTFHRVWTFDAHRVHLSLLPESLVAAVAGEGYAFSLVVMNSDALADYGHVFAVAHLVGARPSFAVTPSFTALALDRGIRQLPGAWFGACSLERAIGARRVA
jgi:hypothetical protein